MSKDPMWLREAMSKSLCWNVWQKGWVSDQDYQDDMDASDMWPAWARRMYYSMVPIMIKKARTTWWGHCLFLYTAYLYIQAINGLDAFKERRWREAWKITAWVPFVQLVIPAFCVGFLLWYFMNPDDYPKSETLQDIEEAEAVDK